MTEKEFFDYKVDRAITDDALAESVKSVREMLIYMSQFPNAKGNGKRLKKCIAELSPVILGLSMKDRHTATLDGVQYIFGRDMYGNHYMYENKVNNFEGVSTNE